MNKKAKSNTLFHFTCKGNNGIEIIIKILEEGFRITPSREDDLFTLFGYDLKIPMICFCDIPLMRVSSHINKFGHYGLGISRKWAEKNNIVPVIYINKKSLLFKVINKNDTTRSLVPYIKRMYKRNRNYTEENEWRFIPNPLTITNCRTNDLNMKTKEYFLSRGITEDKLTFLNDAINYQYLKVPEEEFNYLIVNKTREKVDLAERINKSFVIKNKIYLVTRIISLEDLHKDF
jgi:hypothetical protein